MLGASGAVMAVLVIYAMYYPRREVLLFFILPVQIWLLLVVFLGMDFFRLMQELSGGSSAGVAFASHLMGAAYGYAYKSYDLRWSQLLNGRRFRPRLKVFSPETRGKAASPTSSTPRPSSTGTRYAPSVFYTEEPDGLDERLDEILAKIARARPRVVERGGEPHSPGGQPSGTRQAERPCLTCITGQPMVPRSRFVPRPEGPCHDRRIQPPAGPGDRAENA